MIPVPGTRLIGGPGATYEVTGPGWETPRHAYLGARRLFRNFRYPAEALDEAPADESLDVLIRRPLGRSDPTGEKSAFERDVVLALPRIPSFLEWIDLIEPPEGDSSGPWLVFADPHVRPLDRADGLEPGAMVALAFEVVAMLDALHGSGLAVGPMEPSDFLRRGPERWYFLGTDRMEPTKGTESTRDDLSHWARLTEKVLCGGAGEGWPSSEVLPPPLRDRLLWLSERVRLCLEGDPAGRPTTVDELKHGRTGYKGPLAAMRHWLGRPRDGF